MRTWFTADTHFGHSNILRHQPKRGELFDNIREMDEAMICRWNSKISPTDVVYHLGDFGWSLEHSCEILKRLNGVKILVPGNHDKNVISQGAFRRQWESIAPYSYLEVIIEGQLIVMSHFPIWEWHSIDRGTFHLHGHVHGKPTGVPGRIMDVGIDTNGLYPFSFNEVRQAMLNKPIRLHE